MTFINTFQFQMISVITSAVIILGSKMEDNVAVVSCISIFARYNDSELTHLAGSLLPEDGVRPTYAQLYIYDPEEAYRYQIARNENLSLNTMNMLQQIMRIHNTYNSLYQHAYEILERYDAPDYSIKLCVLPGNDPRRSWY